MLQIQSLSKKFKRADTFSLKDINFTIEKSEIVGLIGKNGAGKTTLMKLIAKSIKPTNGDVLLNGKSIYAKSSSLKEVGFMIEESIFNHLSAIEHLKFFIELNGEKKDYDNIKEVLSLVDLWEKRNKNPNSFSFGMKQRLALAICLVTQPKLLILDEPFVGLDPNGVEKLISTLKKWVEKEGTAIMISSHQLSELEEICSRYIYIDHGSLKEDFSSVKGNTTIIELDKNFIYNEYYKKKYSDDLKVGTNNKIIEIDAHSQIFTELLGDLTKDYKIINIKEKDNLIHQRFKGEE